MVNDKSSSSAAASRQQQQEINTNRHPSSNMIMSRKWSSTRYRPLIAYGLTCLLLNGLMVVWLRLLWIIKFTLSSVPKTIALRSLPSFMSQSVFLNWLALELKWKSQERKSCSVIKLLNEIHVTEPIHIWYGILMQMNERTGDRFRLPDADGKLYLFKKIRNFNYGGGLK